MINSFFYNDSKHTVTLARVATSSSSKLRTMPLEALTSTAPSFPSFRRQNPTTLSCHASFDGLNTRRNRTTKVAAGSKVESSSFPLEKKRKVVEHVCLLKAKKFLSDEDEKDMLDYLYTSQYQMRGIVAVSLGRISNDNVENYTHAVFMRFQTKEDVTRFYENPFYLKVLKEHVMPYCHDLVNVDYESEVEDDIIPIFRKGEEFNYGVEFVHLFAFDDSALGAPVADALASLEKLKKEFPSLIVQSTQGSNFNLNSKEYTHAVVTRFRSSEAFEIFVGSTEYRDVRRLLIHAAYFYVFSSPLKV
ncbi:stress-response A/B barrel domain-containing protein UP3 isoform X2 [Populus alba x Populus x berolinensis]|nr:stress-response A/B barrel domain-containing protein UP3 isoform X2 [Populus alba x Populus x berolinensis]